MAGIEDAKTIVEGSALRAMKLMRKFSRYIFIEKDSRKLAELKETIEPHASVGEKIEFICGSADVEIAKLCPHLNKPNVRSVVFLDPFGSQVGWTTLEALASTRHVDLWYLFPAGLSVNRQISSRFELTPEQEKSLDRLFGPNDWRNRFGKTEITRGLFDAMEEKSKSTTIDDITRFMIESMSKIFAGGVRNEWLPLGRDGAHWYSLLFAMANASPQAKKIAHDVAKHLLTMKRNGWT